MNIGAIFATYFIDPITNLLIAIYQLLVFLHIPYPLGFAIILLTLLIRIVLYPITAKQIKSAAKMQKAAPHIAAMKVKHKDDKKKQQEETMRIYKEHGINPAAGCLPLILQLVIFICLYQVLFHAVSTENPAEAIKKINAVLYFPWLHINGVWDTTFFGLPLGWNVLKHIQQYPLLVLIPVFTGAVQFVLAKMMLPHPDDAPVKEKGKPDDFQTSFQKQSLFLFPIVIAVSSFNFAIGLSLYWNASNIFGILQQYLLVGPGGAHHWFAKAKLHGRKRS